MMLTIKPEVTGTSGLQTPDQCSPHKVTVSDSRNLGMLLYRNLHTRISIADGVFLPNLSQMFFLEIEGNLIVKIFIQIQLSFFIVMFCEELATRIWHF